MGPIEIVFLLIGWAFPILILVWLFRTVSNFRSRLSRIERKLDQLHNERVP